MCYILDFTKNRSTLDSMASTNPKTSYYLVSAYRPILSSESGYGRTFNMASPHGVFPIKTAIMGRGLSI